MSVVLWITMISYLTVGMILDLAMLNYYREEKQGWSGNAKADKLAMLITSLVWPFTVLYGIYKMYIKKEGNK